MGRFLSVTRACSYSVTVFMGPIAAANSPDNQLSPVAVAASNDAWAVGLSSNSRLSIGEGLIEHWNGVSWTVVPNANPGATLYGFNGVAVASSSDVWALDILRRRPALRPKL
jgi:hypothetical protein